MVPHIQGETCEGLRGPRTGLGRSQQCLAIRPLGPIPLNIVLSGEVTNLDVLNANYVINTLKTKINLTYIYMLS